MATSSTQADSLTSSSSLVQSLASKPLFSGIYAAVADRLICGETDMMSNVKFGACVGVGTMVGGLVGTYVADSMGSTASSGSNLSGEGFFSVSGTTVLQRALEIGVGSGVAYAVNKYALNNDVDYTQSMYMKLGIIAGSQWAADYTMDYLMVRPLSYLG
jgi:hypothetical protein